MTKNKGEREKKKRERDREREKERESAYAGRRTTEIKRNRLPRGIIWSVVPLPRLVVYSNYNWAVAGQQP